MGNANCSILQFTVKMEQMNSKKIIIALVACFLLSAFVADKDTTTFVYPKNKEVAMTMRTDLFKKFSEEWRGEDYYYMGSSKDGFILSVLFYKLNKSEKKFLEKVKAESGVNKNSPVYAAEHFLSNAKLKEYQSNEQRWGDPDGDFMFSQHDIKEYAGQKINQKNMFAYGMYGSDMYVKVHMSKILCTSADSSLMREVMSTLKK